MDEALHSALQKSPKKIVELYKRGIAFRSAISAIKEFKALLADGNETPDFYLKQINDIMLSLPVIRGKDTDSYDYRSAMLKLNDIMSVLSRFDVADLTEKEYKELLNTIDEVANLLTLIAISVSSEFRRIAEELILN